MMMCMIRKKRTDISGIIADQTIPNVYPSAVPMKAPNAFATLNVWIYHVRTLQREKHGDEP